MEPVYGKGHKKPDKPVHWVIQYRDRGTGKLVSTRTTWAKTQDPLAALSDCFGMDRITDAFVFYVAGTTKTDLRKLLRLLPE
jgi:hypothetical protein